MMKILVVGNGFDKQHELKTGYVDFIKFCDAVKNVDICKKRGGLMDYLPEEKILYDQLYNNGVELYKEFIDIVDSFWITYFSELKNRIGEKWINFETEIERVVKDILTEWKEERNAGRPYSNMAGKNTYRYFRKYNTAMTYGKCFEILQEDLKKLDRALEIYLCIIVEKEMEGKSEFPLFSSLRPDKVLSFNYTRTFIEIYDHDGNTEYDFIHGKAELSRKMEECNLVLGFDDHYFEKADTVLELVPFEKYYQRIVNRTGNKYLNWLEEKSDAGTLIKKNIYFYGHSMSPADGDILKSLILCPEAKTTIFYRKGHEEERAGMIQNLAVVLTPEELIKRTGGKDPLIEFVEVDFEESNSECKTIIVR